MQHYLSSGFVHKLINLKRLVTQTQKNPSAAVSQTSELEPSNIIIIIMSSDRSVQSKTSVLNGHKHTHTHTHIKQRSNKWTQINRLSVRKHQSQKDEDRSISHLLLVPEHSITHLRRHLHVRSHTLDHFKLWTERREELDRSSAVWRTKALLTCSTGVSYINTHILYTRTHTVHTHTVHTLTFCTHTHTHCTHTHILYTHTHILYTNTHTHTHTHTLYTHSHSVI